MNLREHTPLFAHVRTIFDAGVGRMPDVRTQTQLLAQNKVFLKTVMAGVQKLVPDVNAAREKRPSITIAAENDPVPILEDIIQISTPPERRVSFSTNVSSYDVPSYDIPPYDVPSTPITPIITTAAITANTVTTITPEDNIEQEEQKEHENILQTLQTTVSLLQTTVEQLQKEMEEVRQLLPRPQSDVPVTDSGSLPPARSVA
jgi:hypothetical protein